MWRLVLQWLLICALASSGAALPRTAEAGSAHHDMAAHDMASMPGHDMSDMAPGADCCDDPGCDCGCVVAPAMAMRLASAATRLVHDVPAPLRAARTIPPRHPPPLRPPSA